MTENTTFHYLLGLKLQCKHNFKQFIIPQQQIYFYYKITSIKVKVMLWSERNNQLQVHAETPGRKGREDSILDSVRLAKQNMIHCCL